MKKCLLVVPVLCAVVLAIHNPASADCTISQLNQPSSTAAEGLGQSFTACQTGYVKSITVFHASTTNVQATLACQAGTVIYPQSDPQSVTLVPGVNTVALHTPLSVTSGMVYSFGLMLPEGQTLGLRDGLADPYAGGVFLYVLADGTNQQQPAWDLYFEAEIVSDKPVATRPAAWGSVKALYR